MSLMVPLSESPAAAGRPARSWARPAAVSLVAVLLAGAGLVLAGATSPATRAAAPTSSFAFEGFTAGLLATPAYSFTSGLGWYGPGPYLQVSGPDGTWMFAATGPDGARLEAGRTYRDAVGYLTVDRPFFVLSSDSPCGDSGCGWADFTVHDVGYDAEGRFTRLSVSFSMKCRAMTGEIRFDTSTPAFAALQQDPFCSTGGGFPDTVVGQASAPMAQTFTNVGSRAIRFGQAGFTGFFTSDFEIVADTCSNTTLAVGGSCSISARFVPTRRGNRWTDLAIATDYGSGARQITLSGRAVVPTSTTLEVPAGTAWSPVRLAAVVSPNPGSSTYVRFVFPDQPSLHAEGLLDASGRAVAEVALAPGSHRVRAEFPGADDYEPSRSAIATLQVQRSTATTLELTSDRPTVVSTARPTLTARLSPAGVIDGGELFIWDETTHEQLGTMQVTPGDQALVIRPLLNGAGQHWITAHYRGFGRFLASSAQVYVLVVLDEDVDVAVSVTPLTFYPHPDGFRDQVDIVLRRAEAASVTATIASEADGSLVMEGAAPLATGEVALSWDGRLPGGALVPAGYYRLRLVLGDEAGNTRIVERRIVLSHDWVAWTTESVTRNGARYSLYGTSLDAKVSRTLSSYRNGVRLISGKGLATVQYALPVSPSSIYGQMTFSVLGRSPNGHQALLAVWNPSLGDHRDLDHFDAPARAGPAYGWWSTDTLATERVRLGAIRATVTVWRGLGASGPSTFDISRVRLTYQVGTLQRVTSASAATAIPEADLVEDYLADTRGRKDGRTARDLAGGRAGGWMRERAAASEDSTPVGEGPRTEPPAASEEPGATDAPVADASPTPEPSPDGGPVVAPTPTPAPVPEPTDAAATAVPTAAPTEVPDQPPDPPTSTPEPSPEPT